MSHSSKTKLSDPTQASENGQRSNTGPSMTGEQPPYNMFEMISHTFQLVTSIHQKLDAQAKDFTSLYNDVHKSGGIEDRLQSAISEVDDQTTQIAQVTKENENLRKDMTLMKSYIVRLEQKVESQQKQITDIVARNMRENAIFTGIPESETDLRAYLKTFFTDKLELDGNEIKIDRVHRFGQKFDNRPRPVVAHFHDYADRENILTQAREKRDDINIRVSAQYPDGVREKRKHLYQVQKRYSDENVQTKLKGDTLIFNNGSVYREKVQIPKAHVVLDDNANRKLFTFETGDTVSEKGNRFCGRATTVKTYGECREAIVQAMREPEVARATHNIMAYRFEDEHGKFHEGIDDDGEHGAASHILRILRDLDARDTLAIVSRYATEKIGPGRFTHIANCARTATQYLIDT